MPAAAARGCAHHHRLLALFLLLLAACAAAWTVPALPQQPTKRLSSSSRRPVTMSSSTKGVLFICLGNICRSPSAEAVFKAVVEKNGQSSAFKIDSCGTGGGNPNWYQEGGWSYHEGEAADSRMRAAASKRGITITSRSRPLNPDDIEEFDLLICMDGSNKSAVMEAADHWGLTQQAASKIKLMCDYCTRHTDKKVPDPYYGGQDGFEKVLDLLEDACEGLLQSMK